MTEDDDARAADALSPPDRRRGLRNNPSMVAVMVVVGVAAVVFVMVLAIG